MTRTRRIAVDQTDGVPFADIGLTWIMPDGSAGRVAYDLVAGTNDTPDARTIYFPIAYGGAAYTSIALWGNGFASFGPVTVAQTNFMASGQAFSNPLGFPGDFVARPISGSAGTICAYEGIIDRTGPAPFAIEEAIDFLNLSWYTNVLESFEIQNPAGPIIQLTNDFASLPPGTFYRLGGVAGQNQGTVALVIASSGTTASGSAGNDVIKGFAGGDVIDGGNGADTLNGYGGNDRISGGNDNDMLIGGDGNDLLLPGAGADSVFGGNGIDTVSYATDNIRVQVNLSTGQGAAGAVGDSYVGVENAIGGILSDSLIGSEVSNLLDGGADDDELLGFGGDDLLLPGSGTDTVIGGTGIDTVSYANDNIRVQVNLSTGQGSAGAAGDTYAEIENVVGGILSDSLIGNAFDNRLEGGGDNDELLGFDGNDTLIGGAGADALTGGAGSDTASYAGDDGAVFVNLTLGQGFGNAAQGDTLAQIENLVGTESGDFFIGDAQINRLDGGPGNDVLIGALAGDVLIGGTGSDFASYEDNYGGVFINFLTGQGFGNAAQGDTYQGIENLRGSVFDDFFIGNDAVNILEGNAGNDVLIGALGGDVLVGGAGSDWASYEENYGAVFVNLSVGLGFGNAAQGDSYQEIENLRGGVFFDTLIGDTGANTLDGGRGNDTLTGAAGADVFAFTTALDGVINVDTITDMAAGSDKISLSASVFGAVGATGPLASSAFVVGANATTADHRIIYHSATGNLFYDADGSGAGAAVLFAKVVPGIALTAADFLIG